MDFFKRKCNRDIFERTIKNKKGEEVTVLRSTADLDSSEMTIAIDRFRNWAASEALIYLPSPNEHQHLVHMQKEIERNKQWI